MHLLFEEENSMYNTTNIFKCWIKDFKNGKNSLSLFIKAYGYLKKISSKRSNGHSFIAI